MLKAIVDTIPIVVPEVGQRFDVYSVMNMFETIMDTDETITKDIVFLNLLV